MVQRQHDHSVWRGPSRGLPLCGLSERLSPCWVLVLGLRFTLLCCRSPQAAPTAWDRHPPLQEDEAFGSDALRGSKRCWSKHLEETWSLLTQQCQQPKYHFSPSSHRNNQPLCTAAACPAWVHASSRRHATTAQRAEQTGPSPTSHQPQGSCWASSNPAPSYHSNSFTLYSIKLIKF